MTHSAKDARGGHNGHYWKPSTFRKRFHRREARRESRQIVRQATISWYADLWDDHLAQLKLDLEDDSFYAFEDEWKREWDAHTVFTDELQEGHYDRLYENDHYDPFDGYDDIGTFGGEHSDPMFLSHAPDLSDVPTVDLLAEINRRRITIDLDGLDDHMADVLENKIDPTPTVHYAISGRDESLGAILQRALDTVKPVGEL